MNISEAEKLFLQGQLTEAMDAFTALGHEGCARAFFFLAEYYAFGFNDIKEDPDISRRLLEKGSEMGDPMCRLNLAYTMEIDSPLFINTISESLPDIQQLAASGDIFALNETSDLYMNGWGVAQDITKGIEIKKACSEAGLWQASFSLAEYYDSLGTPESAEESLKWLQIAADQGYERAKTALAVMKLLEE